MTEFNFHLENGQWVRRSADYHQSRPVASVSVSYRCGHLQVIIGGYVAAPGVNYAEDLTEDAALDALKNALAQLCGGAK